MCNIGKVIITHIYIYIILICVYFSTQCAAVTAQFSLNNAAPHLCKYVDVLHCLSEIFFIQTIVY